MQRLNTLNKTYESGEVLYNDNLNQIIDYINQSINAINELMINNDINVGHYEIRYKDSLSEPSPPSTGSSGLSDGWKRSIDSAVYDIWMSQCFVTIGNTYGTWTKSIKISSKDGNNGSFIQEVYRNDSATEINSVYIPEVIDNDYSSSAFPPVGWTTTIQTRAEGEYTWCIQRTISFDRNNNPIYGKWSVPFRITGDNGKDGEDGKYLEYIYKCFTSKQTWQQTDFNPATWSISDTLSNIQSGQKNHLNPQREDYIGPSEQGWTDNPQGVDEIHKYEYACQRTYNGKSYGAFTSPVLWSKYGDKGRDGDGVEYIFWGRTEAVTDWNAFSQDSQNLVNYPPSWTNNEGFQNDEYFGPDGSLWIDDALGIDDIRRYIYMSKRKKIQDPQTRISSWDSFSIPVLWNQYGGTTSFTSNIFKRSSTKPNKPGANEGSFLHPVPTGWSDGIPAGTDSIWITSRIFSSNGQYPQQEEWSDVQLMSDTESFDVEFSPIESNPGTPTTNPNNWYDPTTDVNANWANMIWMATRTKSNGVWGNWNIIKVKGEKGDSSSGSTFDDTELRNAISALQSSLADANTAAESERTRLTNLINNLDTSIQNKIENLLDDATWIQNNFPEGTTGGGSNFGQSDVESYLQTLGFWTTDGDNNTITQWSKLSQDVTSISGRVTQLEGNTAAGGEIDYSLLSSSLYTYILDNYTTAGMESTWAKFAQLTNGDMQMLKWMSSGMNNQASDQISVANLFAAANDYQTNQSAIADVTTLVTRDNNNNLIASTAMTAMVDNAISGIKSDVGSNYANTTIFNKIDDNESVLAALVTKVTGNSSSSTMLSKIQNMSSGVATITDITTATASMLTSNDITDLNSALNLTIDSKINTAKATLVSRVNGVEATIDAIVDESGSSVMVKANKIQLDGQVIANKLKTLNTFQVGNDENLHFVTTTEGDSDEQRGLIFYNQQGVDVGAFYIDSNGYLQLRLLGPDGSMYNIDWDSMNKMTTTVQTPIHQWNLVGGYGVISNSTDPSRFPNTYLYNQVLGDMTDDEIRIIKGIYGNDSSQKVPVYKYQTNYQEELDINGYFSKGLQSTPPTNHVEEGYYTFSGESSDIMLYTTIERVYRWLNSTYSDNDLVDYELLPQTLSDMNYILEGNPENAGWGGALYLGTQQNSSTLIDPVYVIGLTMRHIYGTQRVSFLINKSAYDSIR